MIKKFKPINKAYKFRIYPNQEQQELIDKTIGCSRFIYNEFLAKSKDNQYKSYSKNSKELTQLKSIFLFTFQYKYTKRWIIIKLKNYFFYR